MAAIISSNTLGLLNNSLGQRGTFGSSNAGQSGEQMVVNVATGNLVLQRQDELLAAHGLDMQALRTYNSQGRFNDDNGDNWQGALSPGQVSLSGGVLGQTGSSLQWIAQDGAEFSFTWDGASSAYLSSDGDGAWLSIRIEASSGNFIWQDGQHLLTQVYDASGHLLSRSDASGNTQSFIWQGDLLKQVKAANGDTMFYDYEGNRLQQIRSQWSEGDQSGQSKQINRVQYGYDGAGRLETVTVDLTPEDGTDTKTWRTSYGYDGSSNRVASISNSDGTRTSFGWQLVSDAQHGSTWRVASVTDGENHTIHFDYLDGSTRVTDAANQVTQYDYDAKGQLTRVMMPLQDGARRTIEYTWDNANGNLLQIREAGSAPGGTGAVQDYLTTFEYDAKGALKLQRDALGNTVTRQYDANERMTAQLQWALPDPDGAGVKTPGRAMVTRQVLDARGRVRFVISPENRVTENRYNALGELDSSIVWNANDHPLPATLTDVLMTAWATQQTPTHQQRTDYRYDARGNLASSTTWQNGLDAGNMAASSRSTTLYLYDQAGQLLQTTDAAQYQTNYAYDGLGRKLSVTNAAREQSITVYDDARQQVITRAANGLITTAVRDKNGDVVQVLRASAADYATDPASLGSESLRLDANRQLRMMQDASGVAHYVLYDHLGRKSAEVDGTGAVTEYVYDLHNNLIRSIARVQRLSSVQLQRLQQDPLNAELATLGVVADPEDRITRQIFDAAGRLVRTVDALGYVTSLNYDGASRLLGSNAGGKPLSASQLNALAAMDRANQVASPTDANLVPAIDYVNDRAIRHFYDNDGLLLGSLDAEGYLTTFDYNGAGQQVHSVRWSIAPSLAVRTWDTLANLLKSIADNPDHDAELDANTYSFWNARGQLVLQVDAENYVTRWEYDSRGNLALTRRYATRLQTEVDPAMAFDDPALLPGEAPQDQISTSVFDALGRVKESTNFEGTRTTRQYDMAGKLIATVTGAGQGVDAGDVRASDVRLDLQGRVIAELSGEGSRLLRATQLDAAGIEAIWNSYATRYTLDNAGRRTSSTDPAGRVTLFWYDASARLEWTINAAGDVLHQHYNAMGEVERSTSLPGKLGQQALAQLVAQVRANPGQRLPFPLDPAVDASVDAITIFSRDRRGQVINQTDALGFKSDFMWDAFGLLRSQTLPGPNGRSNSLYVRDRRGLVVETRDDSGHLNTVHKEKFDAFGRLIESTDQNGNKTTQQYDRLGRQILVSGPVLSNGLQARSTTSWDAFGRILTQTGQRGRIASTWSYDDQARSFTISSAEGVNVTTVNDRFGQRVSVTDGNGNVTHFEYDGDNRLLRQSDAVGESRNTWDAAGLLSESVDGRGIVTRFAWDASNRILSKTIDPARLDANGKPLGLNLSTQYEYDPQRRFMNVTDPNGVVTQTRFDKKGQITAIIHDLNGEKLTTSYTLAGDGTTLKVVEPNGLSTVYGFDYLGRRISQTVSGAGGVNLLTQYKYDANSNLIETIDPNGNSVRQFYDQSNDLSWRVDAEGNVTGFTYNFNGSEVERIHYATPIARSALPATATAAQLAALVQSDLRRDEVIRTGYDADGRVRSIIDGAGFVQGRVYDDNGNLALVVRFETPIAGYPENGPRGDVFSMDSAYQTTSTTWDARNRVVYVINDDGKVTHNVYDANDNVVQQIEYANRVYPDFYSDRESLPDVAEIRRRVRSAGNVDAADPEHTGTPTDRNNRIKLFRYDSANRQSASASLLANSADGSLAWAVQAQVLDGDGNTLAHDAYGVAVAGVNGSVLSSAAREALFDQLLAAPRNGATDQHERYVRDAFGRVTALATAQGVDALGQLRWAISRQSFDVAGNLSMRLDYATALTSALTSSGANLDTAAQIGQFVAGVSASSLDHTRRWFYDSANRLTFAVEPNGAVTHNVYDNNGNVLTQVAYADAVNPLTVTTQAKLQSALAPADSTFANWRNWVNNGSNRLQSTVYDGDNRAEARLDALGQVQTMQYDGKGNLLRNTRHANAVNPALLLSRPDRATLNAALTPSSNDRTDLQFYDSGNRLVVQVDAENHVTRNRYGSNWGYMTGQDRLALAVPGLSAGMSWSSLEAALNANPQQRTTSTLYRHSALGNLLEVTDAERNTEFYEYDQFQQKVRYRNANGAEWQYEYDSDGHMVRELGPATSVSSNSVDASGHISDGATEPVQAVQRFSYDVFGHLLRHTEAKLSPQSGPVRPGESLPMLETALRVTSYTYDALGHQTGTIAPAVQVLVAAGLTNPALAAQAALTTVTPTTRTTWDVFGQAVANEDAGGVVLAGGQRLARGNASYKTYDASGRLQFEIDAAGYVTQYQRNTFGEVTRLLHFASAITPPVLNAPPANALPVARLWTALVGSAPTPSNDQVRVWAAMLDQSLPPETVAQAIIAANPDLYPAGLSERDFIINLYHHGFGLDREPVESEINWWLSTLAVLDHSYAKLAVSFINVADAANSDGIAFNARVRQTLAPWDSGQSSMSGEAVRAALHPGAQDRAINYERDLLGREVRRIEPAADLHDAEHLLTGVDARLAKVSDTSWDAFGQSIALTVYGARQDEATGKLIGPAQTVQNTSITFYNRVGQVVANFSPVEASKTNDQLSGYLTTQSWDANGNLTGRIEYARLQTASRAALLAQARLGSAPVPPDAGDETTGFDRETRWTYDGENHKTSETKVNVSFSLDREVYEADPWLDRGDLTTRFGYDRVGNLIWTRDPANRVTISNYDARGFVTAIIANGTGEDSGEHAHEGKVISFRRDLFGQVLAMTEHAVSSHTDDGNWRIVVPATHPEDRTTRSSWDSHGNAIANQDAEDHVVQTAYDSLGRMVRQTQRVTNALFYTSETKVTLLTYDAAGRVVDTASNNVYRAKDTGFFGGITIIDRSDGFVHQRLSYNGFGDLMARDEIQTDASGNQLSRQSIEQHSYDNAGHHIADLVNGVRHNYQNDLEGRTTVTLHQGQRGEWLNEQTGFDLAGHTIWTRGTSETSGAALAQTVDRWDNVLTRTDARGWVTRYTWNANNQLLTTVLPVLDADHPDAPPGSNVLRSVYDEAGRVSIKVDARANWTRMHYDANDNLVREDHPDGGVVTHEYNLFGNQTSTRTTRDDDASHDLITRYQWTHLGQLKHTISAPVHSFASTAYGGNVELVDLGAQALIDDNVYDELGRRIQTSNTAGETTSLRYDLAGNVIVSRDAFNFDTVSGFDNAGHKLVEINANHDVRSWHYNELGQLDEAVDMAGTVTRYGWDASGEMISQDSTPVTATPSSNSTPPPTSILAKHLSFTWQQGKLTDISDTSQTLTISGAVSTATKATHYGYDAVGNRTLERMVVTDAQNHSELLQNNHIRFDAQNRVLDVHDTDRLDEEGGALDIFYVRYDYDENGNRIRTRTRFHDNKNQVHDLDTWNFYDEMNRAVVINGDRNGEDGTFGQNTHVLSYDRAGNRLSDEYLGKAVMARPIVEGDPNAPVLFYDVANAHAIETWHYDAIGRLIETWRGNTQQAEVLETDVRNYDKAGRIVRSGAIGVAEVPSPIPSPEDHEFTNLGATLKELGITAEYRLAVYDKSHRIREKGIGLAGAGADPDPSTDIYFVDALAGSPADPASRFKTGYDGVGNLLGYTIVSATGLTRTMTDWRKGETYQESIVTSKNFDQDNKPNPGQATTTSWYDANGNRVRMQDVDIHSIITGVRNFDYDVSGHVLKKLDNVYAQPATTTTRSLIVNDNEIGNDDAAAAGEFGSAWESVSSSTFTTAPTTYTVQGDGETLQSVARTLWGDSRLWYRIADANGLHSSALSKNQILTIPARATTVHDDANTYRPYDVNRHIGSSTPAMPGPTPAAPCGGMGPVITLIIVIIVIALSQGAASGAAGSAGTGGGAAAETGIVAAETGASVGSSVSFGQLATRALVSNMVSQGIGTIIGTQQEVSFKSMALSVVTAGIGFGLGNTLGSSLGGTIARAAISNAATQVVGMVTHLQETPFSWRAVVGAGISSAVEYGVNKLNISAQANANAAIRSGNPSMVDSFVASRIGQELIGFSAQYAGAAVSGLYQHGKINSAQIAVDVFGNLVGNAVGESIARAVKHQESTALVNGMSYVDPLDGAISSRPTGYQSIADQLMDRVNVVSDHSDVDDANINEFGWRRLSDGTITDMSPNFGKLASVNGEPALYVPGIDDPSAIRVANTSGMGRLEKFMTDLADEIEQLGIRAQIVDNKLNRSSLLKQFWPSFAVSKLNSAQMGGGGAAFVDTILTPIALGVDLSQAYSNQNLISAMLGDESSQQLLSNGNARLFDFGKAFIKSAEVLANTDLMKTGLDVLEKFQSGTPEEQAKSSRIVFGLMFGSLLGGGGGDALVIKSLESLSEAGSRMRGAFKGFLRTNREVLPAVVTGDAPLANGLTLLNNGELAMVNGGGANGIGVPATRSANPLSAVLERDVHGNEIMYRTMSKEHYLELMETGRLPPTTETSISPNVAYSSKYGGVTVKITTAPGTSAQLQEIGIAANKPAAAQFPKMSTQTGSWMQTNARFKVEGGQMTTQLGQGKAVEILNKNILDIELVRKGDH